MHEGEKNTMQHHKQKQQKIKIQIIKGLYLSYSLLFFFRFHALSIWWEDLVSGIVPV